MTPAFTCWRCLPTFVPECLALCWTWHRNVFDCLRREDNSLCFVCGVPPPRSLRRWNNLVLDGFPLGARLLSSHLVSARGLPEKRRDHLEVTTLRAFIIFPQARPRHGLDWTGVILLGVVASPSTGLVWFGYSSEPMSCKNANRLSVSTRARIVNVWIYFYGYYRWNKLLRLLFDWTVWFLAENWRLKWLEGYRVWNLLYATNHT